MEALVVGVEVVVNKALVAAVGILLMAVVEVPLVGVVVGASLMVKVAEVGVVGVPQASEAWSPGMESVCCGPSSHMLERRDLVYNQDNIPENEYK